MKVLPIETSEAWSLTSAGAALLAGITARWAAKSAWHRFRGEAPPDDPELENISLLEAGIWAALAGSLAGTSRMLSRRLAAAAWKKQTGAHPPV